MAVKAENVKHINETPIKQECNELLKRKIEPIKPLKAVKTENRKVKCPESLPVKEVPSEEVSLEGLKKEPSSQELEENNPTTGVKVETFKWEPTEVDDSKPRAVTFEETMFWSTVQPVLLKLEGVSFSTTAVRFNYVGRYFSIIGLRNIIRKGSQAFVYAILKPDSPVILNRSVLKLDERIALRIPENQAICNVIDCTSFIGDLDKQLTVDLTVVGPESVQSYSSTVSALVKLSNEDPTDNTCFSPNQVFLFTPIGDIARTVKTQYFSIADFKGRLARIILRPNNKDGSESFLLVNNMPIGKGVLIGQSLPQIGLPTQDLKLKDKTPLKIDSPFFVQYRPLYSFHDTALLPFIQPVMLSFQLKNPSITCIDYTIELDHFTGSGTSNVFRQNGVVHAFAIIKPKSLDGSILDQPQTLRRTQVSILNAGVRLGTFTEKSTANLVKLEDWNNVDVALVVRGLGSNGLTLNPLVPTSVPGNYINNTNITEM